VTTLDIRVGFPVSFSTTDLTRFVGPAAIAARSGPAYFVFTHDVESIKQRVIVGHDDITKPHRSGFGGVSSFRDFWFTCLPALI